jgi:hypothetical protein
VDFERLPYICAGRGARADARAVTATGAIKSTAKFSTAK